jgi:23S rRNA pseudouridine2457 synthase
MYHYFAAYKPFGMICQFTKEGDHPVLADLGDFPKDVYPIGRLDTDSEGLLLLTNDKALTHRLLDPKFNHHRTYLAQVEGLVTEEALQRLRAGVDLKIDGKDFRTRPAQAESIEAPALPDRNPPIRYRASIPTSWISLSLTEGKNRQVRRMTAAVGFPTLRLVRLAIENLTLGDLQPGVVRAYQQGEFLRLLRLRR